MKVVIKRLSVKTLDKNAYFFKALKVVEIEMSAAIEEKSLTSEIRLHNAFNGTVLVKCANEDLSNIVSKFEEAYILNTPLRVILDSDLVLVSLDRLGG